MPEAQALDSHVLEDLSDSDTEKHPAEALIIRKAEQASAASADTQPAAEQIIPKVRQSSYCKALQSLANACKLSLTKVMPCRNSMSA